MATFELAKHDRSTIVFTSQHPGTKQRYIVGLYVAAERLKQCPWKWAVKGKTDGTNSYVNIRASRQYVVHFGESLGIPWNLTRYYRKAYQVKRQWPGRKTYLLLPDKGVRALLGDIETFQSAMRRNPSVDRRVVDSALRLCKLVLGESKSAPKVLPTPPDMEDVELPHGEIIKAAKKKRTIDAILRKNYKLQPLKSAYGYRCQVDTKHQISIPGGLYVEVHHLKSLADGGPFSDETYSNCLVVCPSCHVLLQEGAIWIEPKDGKTIRHFLKDERFDGCKVKFIKPHKLAKKFLDELARAAKPG